MLASCDGVKVLDRRCNVREGLPPVLWVVLIVLAATIVAALIQGRLMRFDETQ